MNEKIQALNQMIQSWVGSFMISTREIIQFHVALNFDWFLQNGDLPFFIPNFLMSMATLRTSWLAFGSQVPLSYVSSHWQLFLAGGGRAPGRLIQRHHGNEDLSQLGLGVTTSCGHFEEKSTRQFFGWFQEPFTVSRNSGQVSLKSVWGPLKSIIFFLRKIWI